MELHPEPVQALVMILNVVTEFLFDRFVVFRNSINTNARAQRDAEKKEEK